MIYEVLDALDGAVRDPATGINARMAALAGRHKILVPKVAEFHTWDVSKMPSEMVFPTFQQVWAGSPELPIAFNNFWDARHVIEWYYWTDETSDKQARRNIAAAAYAYRKVLDSVLGLATATGSIDDIADAAVDVRGWTHAQDSRLYTCMTLRFTLAERDTTT